MLEKSSKSNNNKNVRCKILFTCQILSGPTRMINFSEILVLKLGMGILSAPLHYYDSFTFVLLKKEGVHC